MEVKINKEIRNYTESVFFGLSLRQCVFSVLAIAVAVILFLILRPYLGIDTLSWLCILAAFPFAAMGFFTYHGMTAEQFLWAWLRSEVIEPKFYACGCNNIYYGLCKDAIETTRKEILDQHDEIHQATFETGERTVPYPAQSAGSNPH